MSQSNLQVLLHEGELLHIVDTIHESNGAAVGGCLFGLWRNSLKQPVIQFVTGPPRQKSYGEPIEDIFNNEYNAKCEEIIKVDHRLLNLGYWFSGTEQEKNKAYDHFAQSSAALLLYVSFNGHELHGQFFLRKGNDEDHGSLCGEDVLSGQSSFRLYDKLTTKIAEAGAKYPKIIPRQENEKLQRLSKYVKQLPSRIEIRDPETKEEQWYSSEDGVALLQSMVGALTADSIEVDMSRDATTHNIQFNLSGGFCLDFPADFPKRMPMLFDSHGQQVRVRYDLNKAPDYCNMVVDAVRLQVQGGNGRRNDNRR